MNFSRPIVPPHEPEYIMFGLATLTFVLMGVYFAWSVTRGLGAWGDLPALLTLVAIAEVPILGVGVSLRRARHKKLAELREYERVLASLAD
jgi:hypothetical protein